MACRPTSYGYESLRFEREVDEHLRCSICYNVLNEPRTCRNNEHMFCLACITEHLKVNSQTCPECNEVLSLDTLRRPRVVSNILSKLKIKCDYASRGCSEFVCVEELQSHVENCGFAPVFCSNEECGMEINKHDKVHHETEACEYRKVKSRDVRQAQDVVAILEGSLTELDEKVTNNHVEVKTILGKFEGRLLGINKRIIEKVEEMKNCHNEMRRDQQEVKKEMEEVTKEVKAVKEKVEEARRETKYEVEEMKKEVTDVKENITKLNKDLDEVKVRMIQMLEKLNLLEVLKNTPREDILIAGGSGPSMNVEQSTEIYSWEKNCWIEVAEMNEEHDGASSFIYKDQLFVVGGDDTKTIETLDLNEFSLKWMKFPGELPCKCLGGRTVFFQERIIHIGGGNTDEKKVSNVISELQLTSPGTMKELCQMPEPRVYHSAELFEDKVLIMGGLNASDLDKEDGLVVLDSGLEFDINQKEYKEMAPLPHALLGMATVRWRDKVVVLGGVNEKEEILNDVFMYDCKTGKITALPSMLEKRWKCCAIITGNIIVVMGGEDEDEDELDSVECFTMGGYTWEYLPDMNKARKDAIVEVLPSTKKNV